MKNKNQVALNQSSPTGWYDDDLEVEMVYKVDAWDSQSQRAQFNTLYRDNRGRFFLAETRRTENWKDLPATAFHELSVREACEWAAFIDGKWDSSSGSFGPLIEATLKLLPEKDEEVFPERCRRCIRGQN